MTELPPILTGDEQNQIRQLRDYLIRLAQTPQERQESVATSGGDADEKINALDSRVKGKISSLDSRLAGIWDKIYPVGSIYMSVNAASPATLFGGTWARITGRFLLAATDNGANGGNSNASIKPGYTGGEATHTLSIYEMPSHSHEEPPWMWAVSKDFNTGSYHLNYSGGSGDADTYNDGKSKQTQYVTNTGGGGAHNNMPPYLAVYVWKRTA